MQEFLRRQGKWREKHNNVQQSAYCTPLMSLKIHKCLYNSMMRAKQDGFSFSECSRNCAGLNYDINHVHCNLIKQCMR